MGEGFYQEEERVIIVKDKCEWCGREDVELGFFGTDCIVMCARCANITRLTGFLVLVGFVGLFFVIKWLT